MFQVGDRVKAVRDAPYTVTTNGWEGVVTAVNGAYFDIGMFNNLNSRFFKLVVQPEVKQVNVKEKIMRTDRAILNAVKLLKQSEYKTTAIKVELEANIDRFNNVEDVQRDILFRLESLGLSKKVDGVWKVKKPLSFLKVYNDHSVDTECTFTLMLNNNKNILLLPKIIRVFTDVCEENGDYFEVDNAGMHIALLNNARGVYPARPKPDDTVRFKNFRKSMIRLLPALYFLGSHDSNCRGLSFRKPQIEDNARPSAGRYSDDNGKYSAVAYREGSIEFRVFETCYENPDAILDMVVVISKAMKFWTTEYTKNNMPKLKKKIRFGTEGYGLNRLFIMTEHIDLLNAGLNALKPDYYTLKTLKQQRNFTITKQSITTKLRETKLTAVKNYKEYEKRYAWNTIYKEQDYIRRELSRYSLDFPSADSVPENIDEEMEKIKLKAKAELPKMITAKKTQTKYINEAVERAVPDKGGRWILEDEEEPTPTANVSARPDTPFAEFVDITLNSLQERSL